MVYVPVHHDPYCSYGTVCQAFENGTSFCNCYWPPSHSDPLFAIAFVIAAAIGIVLIIFGGEIIEWLGIR